jgi:hypothetical protein
LSTKRINYVTRFSGELAEGTVMTPRNEEDTPSVIGSPKVRRWSYAVSKMFEEQALFAFRERYGLEGVALRLFGGYGPKQNITWWGAVGVHRPGASGRPQSGTASRRATPSTTWWKGSCAASYAAADGEVPTSRGDPARISRMIGPMKQRAPHPTQLSALRAMGGGFPTL